jgi:SAM-dependent methyltransferase
MEQPTLASHLGWEHLWSLAPKTYRFNAAPDPLAISLANLLSGTCHILDIGCGMGRNALYFLNQGHRVTGLDLSPTALYTLKQATQKQYPALQIVHCSFTDLPFGSSSFDAAIAVNVIYHATKAQIQSVIAQVGEVLRPGGWFIFNLLSKHHWQYGAYLKAVQAGHACECEPGTFRAYPEYAENDMHLPHHFLDREHLDLLLDPYQVVHISEVRAPSPMGESGRWVIHMRC